MITETIEALNFLADLKCLIDWREWRTENMERLAEEKRGERE
jgi:hypothetical protein